jgi:hypothetical protein
MISSAVNNGKTSIKSTEEIAESNGRLGKVYDGETEQIIARVEQQTIPAYIPTDSCKVM